MKKLAYIFFSILLFNNTNAQVTDTIEISLDFNAYLIFESNNLKYNFASNNIKVNKSENKLIIQALEEDFYTTNLMVQCDQKYFIFIIKNNISPKKFLYNYIPKQTIIIDKESVIGIPKKTEVFIDSTNILKQKKEVSKKKTAKKEYQKLTDLLVYEKQEIKTIGDINYGLKSIVTNINVVGDKMLIKIIYNNTTDIDYKIDFYEIIVKEKSSWKRKNTTQDVKIEVLHTSLDFTIIKAKEKIEVVYLIDKITISSKKEVVIRVIENNKHRRGDRSISITIPYQYITRAKAL